MCLFQVKYAPSKKATAVVQLLPGAGGPPDDGNSGGGGGRVYTNVNSSNGKKAHRQSRPPPPPIAHSDKDKGFPSFTSSSSSTKSLAPHITKTPLPIIGGRTDSF